VDYTKRRLIQEVVRHNVDSAAGVRNAAVAARQPTFPVWFWGAVLAAALAYVSYPLQAVSTDRASPRAASRVEPGILRPAPDTAPPLATAETPTMETPLSAPRPLNRALFPLSVKRIVIDPGHGGSNGGAVSKAGVSEKEITLDIGLRLRRLMEEASLDAVMTRHTDRTISLAERVEFANASHADVFVSIHINWMDAHKVRPLETYYVGPTDDPAATELAHRENGESGYSLADYRRLLEQVFMDTRRDESRRLAQTINAELYRSLREINPMLQDRGVKMAPFVVLVGTQMPAILVEVSCLSNEDEVELLKSAYYREKIALALLKGIRSYADNLKGLAQKGS
jgi:N-acetylmuramoyl-L-alanine amidase